MSLVKIHSTANVTLNFITVYWYQCSQQADY